MSPKRPYFLKLSSLPRFQTQHFQRWFSQRQLYVCVRARMQLCVSVGLTAKDPVKHGWKWCLSFPVGRGSALHHSWCGRLTGFPLHTWFSPQLITNNVLFPGKHQYCFQVVQLCFVRTEKRVTFILCQPNEKGIFRMFRGLKLIFVFVLWFLKLYLVWWIKVVKIAFTCPVPPVPYTSKTYFFQRYSM